VIGHGGEVMGGMVASLVTFPEQGTVVSVTSNIGFADTYALALKIAEAFVEQATSQARQCRDQSFGILVLLMNI
jgi:hypothetical protein